MDRKRKKADPQLIILREVLCMAKFCGVAMRVAKEFPECAEHARKAIAAIKRAQVRMIGGEPSRWRASRHVQRLAQDVWERYEVVPY